MAAKTQTKLCPRRRERPTILLKGRRLCEDDFGEATMTENAVNVARCHLHRKLTLPRIKTITGLADESAPKLDLAWSFTLTMS